jgi:hypothetical protein
MVENCIELGTIAFDELAVAKFSLSNSHSDLVFILAANLILGVGMSIGLWVCPTAAEGRLIQVLCRSSSI